MKISQILDKIDEYQLFVPAFQREYVWKRENAKDLISSLIHDYPTGTMLTWDTNSPPELKGSWQYDSRQGAVKIILDGQQRITTLYLLIRDKIPSYYKESEILNDPRGLYVNLSTLELQYYKRTMMENDPLWVNITNIFQRTIRERDIIRGLEEKGVTLDSGAEDKIYDNFRAIDKIPDKEFVEQLVPVRASLKEAIDIFYIVNASGVNLTDAELALAQISGYWPEARALFKTKLETLKAEGFNFKLDFIIYCLLGMLHNSGSEMTKLHSSDNNDKLREAWQQLDSYILDYVVNILRTQAYVDHTSEINSVYAVIPIIRFVFRKGKASLSQEEIKKIIKWFYYSQIRQRYISQLQQKLDKDLGIVSRSDKPFDELLGLIELERPLEITPEEFEGVDIRNALYSLMRWYFKSNNAVCLTTGVGIRQNMGKKYALEWDHIFPYSVLKAIGYNMNNRRKYALAQEVTNRAIITQVANRGKAAKHAKEYLAQVKEKYPQALRLQCIPENPELWELDRFEDFLLARRRLLAEQLNSFLQNITVTESTESEVSVDELIEQGENAEVELKSSLRWDYKFGAVNKKLETVILKTISAFANADGGTLIIGVDDNREVLGLEHDYAELDGTKDEFQLHLQNLVNNMFGKNFCATCLKISFPEVNEKEICMIEVAKSDKPLYLEVNDDGVKSTKFYIRSGNSSQELSIKEINEYLLSRFN